MANVLDALKNLYLKIGGDKSKLNDNHDISDYVNDIGVALKDAIESSTELPIVSVDDNGKALGVVDGNWSKMSIPNEVPAAAVADIGKVLGVVSDGSTGAEYGAVSIPTELPAVAAADIGKVLGVVSDGNTGAEYDLVTSSSPSGGPSIVKMHIYQDGSIDNWRYIENEAALYQSITSLLLQGEAPIFQIFVDSQTVYNSKPSSLTKLDFIMNGCSIEWNQDDPTYGQDAFKVHFMDDRCSFLWEADGGYISFSALT